MATTGTYNFNPQTADVVLNAFAMVGVKRATITTEHLENAAFQANLVGVDFTNRNPNRWQIETIPITLQSGVPTYNLPPQTVAVPAVWIDQILPNPQATPISRILGPLSAVEYASIANKLQLGTPTSFYFNLLTPTPSLTLWLVPSGVPEFVGRALIFKQQQDASIRAGSQLDLPYRFLDAFTQGLAWRLADIYAPDRKADKQNDYMNAFRLAAALDQERVSLKMAPMLSSYFR